MDIQESKGENPKLLTYAEFKEVATGGTMQD